MTEQLTIKEIEGRIELARADCLYWQNQAQADPEALARLLRAEDALIYWDARLSAERCFHAELSTDYLSV